MIGLIKQVDAAVAADPEKKVRGFVAFIHEPDGIPLSLVETRT